MDKYRCDCCGGHINPRTLKCEYCGTQYKEEHDTAIRIEAFHNPVRTFTAKISLDRELMNRPYGSEIAIKELARELSKVIPSMMEVETRFDPEFMRQEVWGRIKIVEPVNTSMMERR